MSSDTWCPLIDSDISSYIDLLQAASAPAAVLISAYALWTAIHMEKTKRKSAAEERNLRGRALATALVPAILEINRKSHWVMSFLKEDARHHMDELRHNMLLHATLNPPPILNESLDNMWLLGGDAAYPLIQLTNLAEQYDRTIEQGIATLRRQDRSETAVEECISHLELLLNAVIIIVNESREKIALIHDGKVNPHKP